MLQAAEAEVRRVHEVLLKLEAERDSAMERIDRIADEPFDTEQQESRGSNVPKPLTRADTRRKR